ncbi:MAG: DUF2141 domain-containing protein [Gammaproteobacteria bacterium]|jgi:uncharacterized protein (DUF2141 family)|nr:DUF2141 domain-containing protein [Gammaproteobacteria bacterium]MBU2278289.1 DUF2141 domain-containing protein [Gammaproteobacteria bacterium]MBU2427688.1 DUF2141 domain-containing protein [Gammaproteobacteria bacterium]
MKKLTVVTSLVAAMLSSAFAAQAHTLTVTVDQISEQSGRLHVALYSDELSYKQGKNAVAALVKSVRGTTQQLVFTDLIEGSYAIKIMHDANDNGELDRNIMGIPSEGYGFSNNAGKFGPASFKEASFRVAADTNQTIHIR